MHWTFGEVEQVLPRIRWANCTSLQPTRKWRHGAQTSTLLDLDDVWKKIAKMLPSTKGFCFCLCFFLESLLFRLRFPRISSWNNLKGLEIKCCCSYPPKVKLLSDYFWGAFVLKTCTAQK